MSVDNGQLDSDAQAREDSLSTVEPPTDADGLLGRLKRHFEQWARLYVEQRVAARTGVDR
ncbi:hypothetical protein DM826_11870 [Halonotius aquaticus]|uniref:Uncharacterized protein n=1 Tax=Halonotius aquaticus TaxID=2216978 RepID=A0A3A6PS56_9EURY|nr:hypothetical protein [Halonotius aquaticus]RJX42330.1 hypothetical protein DM826_11870 [Halonotius aquaticus]